MPGLETLLFLITLSAIVRHTVTATVTGVSLTTVALALIIVGGAGVLISLSLRSRHLGASSPGPAYNRMLDKRDADR